MNRMAFMGLLRRAGSRFLVRWRGGRMWTQATRLRWIEIEKRRKSENAKLRHDVKWKSIAQEAGSPGYRIPGFLASLLTSFSFRVFAFSGFRDLILMATLLAFVPVSASSWQPALPGYRYAFPRDHAS